MNRLLVILGRCSRRPCLCLRSSARLTSVLDKGLKAV